VSQSIDRIVRKLPRDYVHSKEKLVHRYRIILWTSKKAKVLDYRVRISLCGALCWAGRLGGSMKRLASTTFQVSILRVVSVLCVVLILCREN